MEDFFKAALANITRYGDTDVFPFPIEQQIFYDKKNAAIDLLKDVHQHFDSALANHPPVNQRALSAVGYTGFRWATQVDPVWNAYLLALVLSIADDIEQARISTSRKVVFSYRFAWDTNGETLFDKSIGFRTFQEQSLELSSSHKYVMICDIADFYPRIYHHRLENALRKATKQTEIVSRIMRLLSRFSGGVSYGLPVGGPAARLLSELLLDRVDRLLLAEGITFTRYSDDYHVFAESMESAYGNLVFLSERLLENEGLLLQKAKTRVMSRDEFKATIIADSEADSPEESQARQFLKLRLHFDPYSATAEADYDSLQDELAKFDILGMLAREINKTRVHNALTRRLISAVKFLDDSVVDAAVLSMIENLKVLYPVFPSVALLIRDTRERLSLATLDAVFGILRELVHKRSYIVMVPTNLAYAVRLLGFDQSEETDSLLVRVHRESNNLVIRRDVILAMARRGSAYWISSIKTTFQTQSPWERVAMIIGSFALDDEGTHWRKPLGKQLSGMERLALDWAEDKRKIQGWEIPL